MSDASTALHHRVQAYVVDGEKGTETESFDALASDLARFQMARIPAFARLAKARGVSPEALEHADQIPAVPTDVFKLARVAAHPPAADERVFLTSGTTLGSRGAHPFRDLTTYALGAAAHGRRMLCPDRIPCRVLVVGPRPEVAPESSLGFMCALFGQMLGVAPSRYYLHGDTIDAEGLAKDIGFTDLPVLLLGTSFAFVHLLDAKGGPSLALPPGSRAMQTGGFKGKSREVAADELRRGIADRFALPEPHIVSEYGMTELSSQAYEGTLRAALGLGPDMPRGVHVPPPWMRVKAVDGATLQPIADGEIGLARIVDLANVDSVVAVQTQDRVRVVEGGFELLGREAGAPPRGCSLATEEMLAGVF